MTTSYSSSVKGPCIFAAVFFIACSQSPTALAISYSATILVPISDYEISVATGVNGSSIVGFGQADGEQTHALLWNGSASNKVDLHPAGKVTSQLLGTSEIYQVGRASTGELSTVHAFLWTGSAASAIDLHPQGYRESHAVAAWGEIQVGYALPTGAPNSQYHAMLWQGSAASAVDLHPPRFDRTEMHGVFGDVQVGYGTGSATGNAFHALLWNGSAGSVVDLNPSWASRSDALGTYGGAQVGYASVGDGLAAVPHATLWTGSAASAIDLNPSGFALSGINAIYENYQVGYGRSSATNEGHALLWNGSAANVVDLHQYLVGLPKSFTYSEAVGISSNGSIVGYGFDSSFNTYAILWSPVPEPQSLLLLAVAGISAFCHRPLSRRKK